MNLFSDYQAYIQQALSKFIDKKSEELENISKYSAVINNHIKSFLSGGKRIRGLGVIGSYHAFDTKNKASEKSAIKVAAALELFHAAALIHDDIIDNSDTRRNNPSTHKKFSNYHIQNNWRSEASRYGLSTAILLGDLLQMWSDELFQEALQKKYQKHPSESNQCQKYYNKMRSEVITGQYLDLLEENHWQDAPEKEQIARAKKILIYKSAKYTFETPMLLGTTLAGIPKKHHKSITKIAIPLGMAFQLRDDVLGIFGKNEETGKPVGDDLVEAKQTLIIAYTRKNLNVEDRIRFNKLLEKVENSSQEIYWMQEKIKESGALNKIENKIDKYQQEAMEAIQLSDFNNTGKEYFKELCLKATRRNS